MFTVDSATLNYAVYHKLFTEFQVKEQESPIVLAKAIKNPIEVEGFRKACIKDSVALTKFFYWVERNIGNHLTEISVSEQLSAFRAQNDGYAEEVLPTFQLMVPMQHCLTIRLFREKMQNCSHVDFI